MEPPTFFIFGIRLGIFLTVEAAGLSAIAVTGLLSYVAFRTYKRVQFRRQLRKKPNARTDLTFDAADSSFFLNLMVADLIQALGGLFNIRWVAEAHITEGSYCTAQGVFKQMGDVGVALTSLAIACQTFVVLVLRVNVPTYVNKIVIAFIWIFIILVIGVSAGVNNRDGQYYGNTDYWCWITREYKVERIVFEYLWMWIAGGIMLVLYGVIFLVMRGVLKFGSDGTAHPAGLAKVAPQHDGKKDRKNAVANLMLFYPAVYICCILPVCVVRWMDFNGKSVPPAATIFASVVFSLSGLFNVTLYCLTRPQLVSGPRLPTPQRHSRSYSTQKPFKGVRHKLGHLPDIDDDVVDEEIERREYPSQTYPPSHSYGSGRLPDVEYDSSQGRLPDVEYNGIQGRLPSLEYPQDRGRLHTPDGNSFWSNKSGPRPGTGDTVTSEGTYSSRARLGRLPDL